VSTEPLDETYFCWLYRQVAVDEETEPSRTYWRIFKKLHTTEFIWFIPKDDNRVEDGKDLRHEFIEDNDIHGVDDGWLHLGCSMLELIIGLSRRLSFLADGEPQAWFWHLMENLGLEEFNDNRYLDEDLVNEILEQVITRTYARNGRGGLCPLRKPNGDQREVELWYQLSSYVLENGQ
jgi:hypothetical protein